MSGFDFEQRRGVFVLVDPATGMVRGWMVCFEPPDELPEGLLVELPFETDVYSLIDRRRVDLAALHDRKDGRPPLAQLTTHLDS